MKPLSATKRRIYIWLGHVSLFVGFLALLIPIMPTSPFVVLAASCYAKSSQRFHSMLSKSIFFGPIIVNWEEKRCLPRPIILLAALSLVVAFSGTWYFFATSFLWQILIPLFGVLFISLVLLIPSCPREEK